MKCIYRIALLAFFAILSISAPTHAQSSIFLSAPTYSTGGGQAQGVVIADVNGDGIPDLIVANGCNVSTCANSPVGVLLGNGDGTYQTAVTYGIGNGEASSLAVRDVNGDGKLDIIVTDETNGSNSGAVDILLGNGDGTFQTALTYTTGGNDAVAVAVADVNGDGKPDLIVANTCPLGNGAYCGSDVTIGVLLGNGDGTFQAAQIYSSGRCAAQSVVAQDLNGDGNVDILVSSSCNVSILFGTGNGTFQPAAQIFASGGFASVADVNGDGKLDVLVNTPVNSNATSPAGTLNVLLGDGHGVFSLTQSYMAPVNGPIAIADVNGDGKPDLVVGATCTYCANSGVGVFLGNGDGTFQPVQQFTSSGSVTVSLAIADLNGDGKPDIAVTNLCINADNCSESSVGVLFGNGDGTFRSAVPYQVAGSQYTQSAAEGDLNGDGKLDLVFADAYGLTYTSGSILVFLGNGDGTFQQEQSYPSGGFGTRYVALADVNNDGKLDLVMSNQCVTEPECTGTPDGQIAIMLGNGDGTFQPVKTYTVGASQSGPVVVADLNGDGNPDIVVANGLNYYVLLGNGDGTFQAPASFPNGGTADFLASSIAVADVNGDGKPDVIVSNYCTVDPPCQTNGLISVQLGDGKGGFTPFQSYSSGGDETGPIALADLNGDGKLDIVADSGCAPGPCQQNGAHGVLGVLLGNGDGTFQAPTTIPMLTGYYGVGSQLAIADFNGDGKLDVAAGSSGNLFLGNGDGTFQAPLALAASAQGLVAGDFNGDGRMDLAVGWGNVVVLLNDTLTPTQTSLISSGTPTSSGQSVTFTATVAAVGSGTPVGNVTFSVGSTSLGTSSLTAGVATYTTSSLAVGANSITASYPGNSSFAASVSSVLTQTVNAPTPTATSIISSGTPILTGLSVTFTATVTPVGSGIPTGNVTFSDGSAALGTSPLSGGVATYTTTSLVIGAHSITASYAGNLNFAASVSSTMNETITAPPDFTVAAAPAAQTVNPGQSTSFTLTLTPLNGSTQSVAISCAGAPALASCNAATANVNLNGSSSTAVTINVSTTAGSGIPARGPVQFPPLWIWSFAAAAILGGFSIYFSVRRGQRAPYAWMYLLLIILAASAAGCGAPKNGTGNPGTPAGSYTLTLTGTTGSGSSAQTHSTTVTLIVN